MTAAYNYASIQTGRSTPCYGRGVLALRTVSILGKGPYVLKAGKKSALACWNRPGLR